MTRKELISELLEFGEPRTEHGWDKAIDRVLEIIDTVSDDLDFGTKEKSVALSIKEKVMALKGGEQDE